MPELSRTLLSSGHGLLEGPIWHPRYGLVVADADHGGVWSLGAGGLDVLQIPHRRGIGGIALHESGELVVSGRNVALKAMDDPQSPTRVLLDNDPAHHVLGFNDLTTDAAGRIYVGSLSFLAMHALPDGEQPEGCLHRIDLDGTATVVATGVRLTNGLGFSPDGHRLYYADSLRGVVNVHAASPDGSLGPGRPLIRCDEGLPDGLAVSVDGDIWLAQADANRVVRYGDDGRERERFVFDEAMVTSLCFGGDDLRDLYVVTGSRGSTRGGCAYRLRVDVAGVPRTPARVRVPGA
jgi:gluconolactonase